MPAKASAPDLAAQPAKPEKAAAPAAAPLAYRIDALLEQGPLGRTTLFKAIRDGKLRSKKVGSVTFIMADEWERFLRSRPPGPGPARGRQGKAAGGEAAVVRRVSRAKGAAAAAKGRAAGALRPIPTKRGKR